MKHTDISDKIWMQDPNNPTGWKPPTIWQRIKAFITRKPYPKKPMGTLEYVMKGTKDPREIADRALFSRSPFGQFDICSRCNHSEKMEFQNEKTGKTEGNRCMNCGEIVLYS